MIILNADNKIVRIFFIQVLDKTENICYYIFILHEK